MEKSKLEKYREERARHLEKIALTQRVLDPKDLMAATKMQPRWRRR